MFIENDLMYENFNSTEDYFKAHPEEEDSYYDDMAELAHYDEMIDCPEDWAC